MGGHAPAGTRRDLRARGRRLSIRLLLRVRALLAARARLCRGWCAGVGRHSLRPPPRTVAVATGAALVRLVCARRQRGGAHRLGLLHRVQPGHAAPVAARRGRRRLARDVAADAGGAHRFRLAAACCPPPRRVAANGAGLRFRGGGGSGGRQRQRQRRGGGCGRGGAAAARPFWAAGGAGAGRAAPAAQSGGGARAARQRRVCPPPTRPRRQPRTVRVGQLPRPRSGPVQRRTSSTRPRPAARRGGEWRPDWLENKTSRVSLE
mmetsp:Transcript_7749/g.25564  ORF Transcript_7749/g.25564 Transcript_7749/m.25564 type:complete len:263 (+) Transcript_7749:418-1206(+)